jgi:hypothetical protein
MTTDSADTPRPRKRRITANEKLVPVSIIDLLMTRAQLRLLVGGIKRRGSVSPKTIISVAKGALGKEYPNNSQGWQEAIKDLTEEIERRKKEARRGMA